MDNELSSRMTVSFMIRKDVNHLESYSIVTGLKLNIQNTKIMASHPITSWQIDVETVETVADFIFLGSKITAGGEN